MNVSFLRGDNVDLRALDRENATEEYLAWMSDPEVTRFLESGRFPSNISQIADYIEGMFGREDTVFLGIFLKEGNQHVGNIKLSPINWVHRWAELGIMIGAASARGKGVGTESVGLVVDYAFRRLNLHRVQLGVLEGNIGAIRCYEKVGFQEEGRYREASWIDGKPIDTLRMAILATDYWRDAAQSAS